MYACACKKAAPRGGRRRKRNGKGWWRAGEMPPASSSSFEVQRQRRRRRRARESGESKKVAMLNNRPQPDPRRFSLSLSPIHDRGEGLRASAREREGSYSFKGRGGATMPPRTLFSWWICLRKYIRKGYRADVYMGAWEVDWCILRMRIEEKLASL